MAAPKECANCGVARGAGTLIRSLAAAALAGTLALFAAQSVGQQPKKTPRVDPAVAVDSALRPLLPANEPGGTVIITDKGRVVFRKAYGMADLEHKIALKPEMVLRLGSVTKQFTAVAVMLLEQDGKLSLQDDIAKYFPEIKPASVPTTIEHLLRQRSGLFSYTSVPTFWAQRFTDATPQEIIASFKDAPRIEPGSIFNYSNSNYLLAGLIVEKVSGSSYPEFLANRIFEPLGMSSTAYEGFERNGTKRVEGYFKPIGEKWRKVREISMTWPLGAGGLVSSVDDLARWHDAIMAGNLLSAQAWKRVFDVEPSEFMPPYGYGWFVHPTMGRRSYSHGGGIDGFQSFAQHFPDENLYIAVLLNGTGAAFSPATVSRIALEAYWKARGP